MVKSNNMPMRPLDYLSPIEYLEKNGKYENRGLGAGTIAPKYLLSILSNMIDKPTQYICI